MPNTYNTTHWYQTILQIVVGYGDVPINGDHNDPATRKAMRDFQKKNDLNNTGYLETDSNLALTQLALEWILGKEIPITLGKRGNLDDYVKEFQEANDISTTGNVGPQTQNAMVEVLLALVAQRNVEWSQTVLQVAAGYVQVPVNGDENDKITKDAIQHFKNKHDLASKDWGQALIQVALEWIEQEEITNTYGGKSETIEELIKVFQEKHDLPISGLVDPVTISKIKEILKELQCIRLATWVQNVLRTGYEAFYVKVNGDFNDTSTQKALKQFQKKYQLQNTNTLESDTLLGLFQLSLEKILNKKIDNTIGEWSNNLLKAINEYKLLYEPPILGASLGFVLHFSFFDLLLVSNTAELLDNLMNGKYGEFIKKIDNIDEASKLIIEGKAIDVPSGLKFVNYLAKDSEKKDLVFNNSVVRNKSEKRKQSDINSIVLHETAGWESSPSKVTKEWEKVTSASGAHFRILTDGTILQHYDTVLKLKHGDFFNNRSIGIEFSNRVWSDLNEDSFTPPKAVFYNLNREVIAVWKTERYIVPPLVQLEGLVSLIKLLRNNMSDLINLDDRSSWLSVDYNGKKDRFSLYKWDDENIKNAATKAGILAHINISGGEINESDKESKKKVEKDNHSDGWFQNLYCFLRFYENLSPEQAYFVARELLRTLEGRKSNFTVDVSKSSIEGILARM